MAFRGVTFASQNVTPKNDRGLYRAHFLDGVLWGCEMNIVGDELVIQSGEIIAGGSVIQVDGATPIDLSGRTYQTGYIQVVLTIDLTQGEGQQIYPEFYEDNDTSFNSLTKEFIWSVGNIYQIELAVVQISGGNLTNIYRSLGASSLFTGYNLYSRGISSFGWDDVNEYYKGKIDGRNFADGIAYVKQDNLGSTVSGLLAYDDMAVLCAPSGGDGIFLRPNAPFSNIGTVRILPNGQIEGGIGITQDTRSSATTIPAGGSWTTIVGKSGLVKDGIYLVIAYATYQASINQAQAIWLRLSTDNGNYHSVGLGLPYASQYPLEYCEIISGVTQANFQLSTQSSTMNGTALAGATLRIARLG